jgi:hypothetical protein
MSVPSSPQLSTTTPGERWSRWQQRGREQDRRLMEKAKRFLLTAALVTAAATAFGISR